MDKLALELESRRRIFEVVCKYPGMHLREISRTVNLPPNLIDYHLLYLEKHGIVSSLEDGLYKRYFAKGEVGDKKNGALINASEMNIVSVLRQRMPFRIILLILKNGPMTHGKIADGIRKSPSTTSHHLERMVRAGVLVKREATSQFDVSSPERFERILLRFEPHPASLTEGFMEIWDELVL